MLMDYKLGFWKHVSNFEGVADLSEVFAAYADTLQLNDISRKLLWKSLEKDVANLFEHKRLEVSTYKKAAITIEPDGRILINQDPQESDEGQEEGADNTVNENPDVSKDSENVSETKTEPVKKEDQPKPEENIRKNTVFDLLN